MTILHLTDRNGFESRIDAESGVTLMEAIRDAGFNEAFAICGGCLSCATCHVHIDDAHGHDLPAMSDDEDDLLSESEHRDLSSRLSCQIFLTGDIEQLSVRVALEE
ncbi:ferredoxin, 2Fe-2S [Sphingopyxis sp. YR583]|uniref:2Fe-2S iron-sulfur cluster-binding protein n=1 Tax=Sphingopyxis sp. YR583 TaxID=1881047 RepID=UPI0008A79990|nr:2Fe-2S iron-sulfur cluster-binding protein [Sphingopyxis sp. YR583]SEH19141.1 ferredoxin, 2Fe-2S [Sphingopyxis sp. YR583]